MEDGALLGDVDLVAAEHRVDPLAQAALARQGEQQPQRLVRHPVLRVVEEEAGGLDREALRAAGVAREEVPQVDVLDRREVGLEGLPGGSIRQAHADLLGEAGRFKRGAGPSSTSPLGRTMAVSRKPRSTQTKHALNTLSLPIFISRFVTKRSRGG